MTRRNGSRKPLTAEECARAKHLYGRYQWVTVCEMMGITSGTLAALKNRGFQPANRQLRPIPYDFALIADTMNVDDLRRHYKTSPQAIRRWIAEINPSRPKGGAKSLPIPADLATRAATSTITALSQHYGVHRQTIRNWLRTLPVVDRSTGWADRYFAEAA